MTPTNASHDCWPPAVVWALLVLATGVTFAIGEYNFAAAGEFHLLPAGEFNFTAAGDANSLPADRVGAPPLLIGLVLLLAGAKGALVALDFMELRHAPRLWRVVVLGWIALVIAGILAAYLKGLS